MVTKLVGLGFKARQGKTILSEAIKAVAPDRIMLYSFAEGLKRYCAAHHDELYEKYPEVSKAHKEDAIYGYVGMLQHYGTNVARAANPNHWVETLAARINEEKPEVALIADVRFPNEADYVKDNDGLLIRLQRLGTDGKQYLDPLRDSRHPSEIALDDYPSWDILVDCLDGQVVQLQEMGTLLAEVILNASETVSGIPAIPDSTGYSG